MRARRTALVAIGVDPAAPEPLHRQVYGELRAGILGGRLRPGMRLPSSRALADELGVSRNTVLAAFEQLLGEGYIETRRGSGSYVPAVLPEELLAARGAERRPRANRPQPAISRRGQALASQAYVRDLGPGGPFSVGLPDCRDFPFELWARILAKGWRHPAPALYSGSEPAGHMPLRAAIADYLRGVRGMRLGTEQVIVVAGIRPAVELAARVLLDPGDGAWVEEPGFPGIRGALVAADVVPLAVPVDREGMTLPGPAATPAGRPVRLACVTPSHQYPLGAVMSLARRLDLLAWAAADDAWIIEDDYDSEFRFAGRPLAALQSLDEQGRVIYVGNFSKVMFQSLRLGYLVVPEHLIETFVKVRGGIEDLPSSVVQPAVAEFIASGHFAAHIRRMRRRYGLRQELLLAAAARHLTGLLELAPDPTGLHLVGFLAPALAARMSDVEAVARARAANVRALPLSRYYSGRKRRQGLLLGYAAAAESEIEPAVKRLAQALRAK